MAKNGDIEIIKKPHQKEIWTQTQILEVARCIKNPIYFIKNYLKVQHPLKGSIPLELYPYQETIIESFKNQRNTILLTGRQMGKSCCFYTKITYNDTKVKIGNLIKLNFKEKIVNYLELKLVELSR